VIGLFALAAAANLAAASPAFAQPDHPGVCGPIQHGRQVNDPPEIDSTNGVLSVTLHLRGQTDPRFDQVLCWVYTVQTKNGPQTLYTPPTLHVRQGDQMQVTLVNELLAPIPPNDPNAQMGLDIAKHAGGSMSGMSMGNDDTLPCGQQEVGPTPTPDPKTGRIYGYHRSPFNEANLHFHGLNTSPKQPSDNTTMVLLCPRMTPAQAPASYQYVVNIPRDEPPGLYWYHPHAHGESEHQLEAQLTGAIVVDSLKPSVPNQYPNRVIVVRDLGDGETLRPFQSPVIRALRERLPTLAAIRAQIAQFGYPQPRFDAGPDKYPFGPPDQCPTSDGIQFNGKQLLVNGVLLPPKPNEISRLPFTTIPAGQTQYWRLANTSSDTVLDLQILVNGVRVPVQVASRDGVPLVDIGGHPTWQPVPMDHVYLDPASRVEFYLTGTNPGDDIVLRTAYIDTGCIGDTDLERDLMVAHVVSGLPVRRTIPMPHVVDPVPVRFSDLGSAQPVRHRVFALTEYQRDDEPEPDFYITELTNPKAVEHPYEMVGPPDVIVKDGTVEDWTILNYTQEVHAFHIHQIHFLVLQGGGIPRGEGQLLDTVDVPYGVFQPGGKTGDQMTPGAVTLRMDFRAKNIIGEFVYHCHILEHEDNGMMAKIRVVP